VSEAGGSFALSLTTIAERFSLDPDAVAKLKLYAGMLVSDELAPTTVRDPRAVRDDHLADALVALELDQVRSARAIADIGAGAGVPGLPLAIALPGTSVHLIDSSSRKCEFMQRAARALGLRNVQVLHDRAETWSAGFGACDLVTARAVAALDIVEEYAAPLLRIGGSLVAWRGRRDAEVEADGLRAAEILGFDPLPPVRVEPYARADNRHLHVYTKVLPTPERFPRRDGVARKRPLGRA
jgi:16S rRNA (guanine527-N7)-methyltransferase